MNKKDLAILFKNAPISINCQLGDPYQLTQWRGTRNRIRTLEENKHLGPVCTITKSIITEAQANWLRDNIKDIDFTIFFSITGLKEKYPLPRILANFKEVSERCPNIKTVVFIRPIIPGQNDNVDALKEILKIASEYSYNHYVIFRGYKDIEDGYKNVTLDENFIKDFIDECNNLGINILHKSRDIQKDNMLFNIHMSKEDVSDFIHLTGYDKLFECEDNCIKAIDNCHIYTKGDIHFLTMFTGWEVKYEEMNYNKDRSILSIDLLGCKNIDATSSWLGWGENKNCIIRCPYCIAYAEHKDYDYFGTDFDNIVI